MSTQFCPLCGARLYPHFRRKAIALQRGETRRRWERTGQLVCIDREHPAGETAVFTAEEVRELQASLQGVSC